MRGISPAVGYSPVIALFVRAQGCTAREYAQAFGISRQAAAVRLKKLAANGVLEVIEAPQEASLEDLTRKTKPGAAAVRYRAVKR